MKWTATNDTLAEQMILIICGASAWIYTTCRP